MSKILSVLIPTVEGREESFLKLTEHIKKQLCGLGNAVEIISFIDNKQMSIGRKRQHLYQLANGEWSVMIDDDDLVAASYIQNVLTALENNPDCVGYLEQVSGDGQQAIACHSTRFQDWDDRFRSEKWEYPNYDYVRTVFFKDPIRTQIALKVGVSDLRFGEDYDFATRLKKSNLIKTEFFINEVQYYYTCSRIRSNEFNGRYGITNGEDFSISQIAIHGTNKQKTVGNVDQQIKSIKTNTSTRHLKITHNAGFFSCCTVALEQIIAFYNRHHRIPQNVDRSEQYSFYKVNIEEDLTHFFFKEDNLTFPFSGEIAISKDSRELQFSDYSKINFKFLTPFIHRFFNVSDQGMKWVKYFNVTYKVDVAETCAVFYRGNDKQRETTIAPYHYFVEKAKTIFRENPNIRFLIQTDETEFLEAFYEAFPQNTFHFSEIPHILHRDDTVLSGLAKVNRAEFGLMLLAAVQIISKCFHIITHSGNCGLWSALYRGNATNVSQILNNVWLVPPRVNLHTSPSVSIITPITHSRMRFFNTLQEMIASQDYKGPIEHIIVKDEGFVGYKRNLACERASGEIIIHFDSDDWYGPDWVSKSVMHLLLSNADVGGLSSFYFYNETDDLAWRYAFPNSGWVAGATMCYRRSFWQRHKFHNLQIGEDNQFCQGAIVQPHNHMENFVARIHTENTSSKDVNGEFYSASVLPHMPFLKRVLDK